ncbi:MAG: hypothetical protein ACOCYP_08155 [Planctomycetota bacterium]
MDDLTLSQTTWRSQDAWLIAGPGLELVVSVIGAQLAAIRAPGDTLNPLWQPPWPACTPAEGAARSETYGSDAPTAALLANIVGHNPCIDRFGPPHPGEDRPPHGEAGAVPWTVSVGGPDRVLLEAQLPVAGLQLTRSIALDGETAAVHTVVRHDDDAPREIEWAEHATLGSPFIDGADFTAGVDGAWIWSGEPRETWRFPTATDEGPVDPAEALAMPEPDAPPCGDIITTRVTEGLFRVANIAVGRELIYRWDAEAFPWLCLWTQHRSRDGKPWNGATRARGMEFATKPFPDGLPSQERGREFHNRPTVCMVPPGAGLEQTFTITWARL